jgi:hypothetical protein
MHCVISQKTEVFITTAVRASYPTAPALTTILRTALDGRFESHNFTDYGSYVPENFVEDSVIELAS